MACAMLVSMCIPVSADCTGWVEYDRVLLGCVKHECYVHGYHATDHQNYYKAYRYKCCDVNGNMVRYETDGTAWGSCCA